MNRVCFLPERIFILFSCKILFLKNTNFILKITNLLFAFCGAQWPLVRWPVATKRR